MEKNDNKTERMEKLAEDVLTLARNNLLLSLRFLDVAVSSLEPEQHDGGYETDGKKLWYGAGQVLKAFRDDQAEVARSYLHMVMHCVFSHPFVSTSIDREKWDMACDIAVEAVIHDLALKCTLSKRHGSQHEWLEYFKDNIKFLTAEKIYRFISDKRLPEEKIKSIKAAFMTDDPSKWYKEGGAGGDNDSPGGAGGKDESKQNGSGGMDYISDKELQQMWKEIAGRMQTELEAFGKGRGDKAGSLTQNLTALSRERYDYTAFLKKFAVRGEVMKVNDDEFDYIFYTYGLRLYEKMPLIEPLEYKEVKKIREFVIAIDTSGSVSGELVQRFVQKTYNILKSTENFFSKVNIVIIQCDAKIQEAVRITCMEEFDEYISKMKLRGFGGTDFRPVFRYVDGLIKNDSFSNLKGLIYFTDGHGVFPEKNPPYETAFVYIDDEYNNPDVPPWAIKLVLQPDEI